MKKCNTIILRNGKVVLLSNKRIIKRRNAKLSFCRIHTRNFNRFSIKNNTGSNKIIVTSDQNSDEINQHCHNIGYTNLENHVQLNEIQVYNYLKPVMVEEKPKPELSNSLNKKKNLKAINQITNRCITRNEALKLQIENRKKLDQVMIDKFPNITFKNVVIQLCDIFKQIKFLKNLGLNLNVP